MQIDLDLWGKATDSNIEGNYPLTFRIESVCNYLLASIILLAVSRTANGKVRQWIIGFFCLSAHLSLSSFGIIRVFLHQGYLKRYAPGLMKTSCFYHLTIPYSRCHGMDLYSSQALLSRSILAMPQGYSI